MAKSSKFDKILAGAQAKWKAAKKRAKERTPSFQEYDDGRYLARLTGAELGTAQSGRNQIDFSWRFDEGQYEKKIKHDYQGIDTEDNLYWLAQRIEQLGYEWPDDLTDLPEILAAIEKEKPLCTINLKTNGDFQNVYIRKVHGSDEEDEDIEDTDEEADEEDAEVEASDEEESDEADEEADEESDDAVGEEEDEAEGEEDDEAEASDDEEVDLEVGMTVLAETAKGREEGTVIEIVEDEGKVRVKLKNGKVVRVGVDAIEVMDSVDDTPEEPEEEEEEEEPAPPRRPAKPVAKPAASKPLSKPKSGPARRPVAPPAKKKPAPVIKGKKKTRR